MHRTRMVRAALAGALVLAAAACQHDMGTLGGRSSSAYGINDAGSVVGESQTLYSPNAPRAFVSDGDDDALSAITVSDEISSRAWDVNNRGDVVGGLVWPGFPVAGWVKPAGKSVQRLRTGTDPGLALLPYEAVAVNDHGIAVGYLTVELAPGVRTTHAARWDTDNPDPVAAFTDLTPGAAPQSRALAINDKGEIAGWLAGKAVVWMPDGTVRTLPDAGGSDAGAAGINDTGDVVGWVTTPASGGSRRMAHWGTGDKLTVLPGLGQDEAQLSAVNDGRLAVGNARRPGGDTRAVRVDLRGGALTDLAPGTARAVNAGGTAVGEVEGHATYWTLD